MSIDPRLMERRKTVAEEKAKRNIGRLLKFLLIVVVLGSGVWVVFSPWLSVSMVTATGIENSGANAILADRGVMAGTPMIFLRASRVEAALLEDPWVAEAEVDLHWPDEVTVTVTERVPVAWVRTRGGWTRRAVDGVALPSSPRPDEVMARVELPDLADAAVGESSDLLGALKFIDSLHPKLRTGTVVTRRDGELWASVAGYQVRLGRAIEMRQKALSLAALLEKDPPAGSTLVLIAPTNPAVPAAGEPEQSSGEDSADSSDVVSSENGGADDSGQQGNG